MVRSLFGNSNRKLRSTFWGSPFIPVGTNQTECCLPLTNFSVPSRFQTHATQIRPFLDSNRNGCGISTVNWQIAYHYAFATPTGFFCQMVSTPDLKTGMDFRGQDPVVRKAVRAFPWINLYPVHTTIPLLYVRFHVHFHVTFDDLCCKQTRKVRTSVR